MLTEIRLQHFRSYSDESFEFKPKVNIIVGPNASGKTNLLEAVQVAAKGISFRASDADLLQFNKQWGRLDVFLEDNRVRSVKFTSNPQPSKLFVIDGKEYKRLPANQKLPLVLFEPNHLYLLSGPPDIRRTYIDDLLEQLIGDYKLVRNQYKRVLFQRNTLLKQSSSNNSQLFVWNVRLSQLGGRIARERVLLVADINHLLPDLYGQIAGSKTKLSLKYHSSWPVENYESYLLKKLEDNINLDKMRGFTSAGPHREDFLVYYDGHPAGEVASRGETRSGVLALKILELLLLKSRLDSLPMLLLDDVFSELDGLRRRYLTEYIGQYQTFITTTDADIIGRHFMDSANIIPLGMKL